MIGPIIINRLSGQTTAGPRVYPLQLPQNATFPAITYRMVSTTRSHAFGADASVAAVRVQVDCWADTYAQGRALANEVTARLARFKTTVADVTVHDSIQNTEQDLLEPETKRYRVMQDYMLFIEE